MRYEKVSRDVILVLLLVGLTLLVGCATVVRLHPIEKSDIVSMPKGVAYTPEKDGWFLSDYYVDKVMEATVE